MKSSCRYYCRLLYSSFAAEEFIQINFFALLISPALVQQSSAEMFVVGSIP